MRLSYQIQAGKLKMTTLAIWLMQVKGISLFRVSFKQGREPVSGPPDLDKLLGVGQRLLGLPFPVWRMMEIDPVSNLLSLCPPIVRVGQGIIETDHDAYETAMRDEAWPALVLDMDAVDAIWVVTLPSDKRLAKKKATESPDETATETPKDSIGDPRRALSPE